jgi:hypothetical protein
MSLKYFTRLWWARVGLLRASLSLRQMCLNGNLSTFVSTLIKKTDGEQSSPYRHCKRSEAISIGILTILHEIASSLRSSQQRCKTKARQCRRFASLTAALRIPHAFHQLSLVAIHIKPLRGLAEFTFP